MLFTFKKKLSTINVNKLVQNLLKYVQSLSNGYFLRSITLFTLIYAKITTIINEKMAIHAQIGSSSPFAPTIEEITNPGGRPTSIVSRKNPHVIWDMPAIKQMMSSGKKGSRIISTKIFFYFLLRCQNIALLFPFR